MQLFFFPSVVQTVPYWAFLSSFWSLIASGTPCSHFAKCSYPHLSTRGGESCSHLSKQSWIVEWVVILKLARIPGFLCSYVFTFAFHYTRSLSWMFLSCSYPFRKSLSMVWINLCGGYFSSFAVVLMFKKNQKIIVTVENKSPSLPFPICLLPCSYAYILQATPNCATNDSILRFLFLLLVFFVCLLLFVLLFLFLFGCFGFC